MTDCRPAARDAVRGAARALDGTAPVAAVDTLAPAVDPTNCWVLEIVLTSTGVPAPVLDELATHGLTLRSVQPRGETYHAVAVA